MGQEVTQFDLLREWALFRQDLVADKLDPQLSQQGGYFTTAGLNEVALYELGDAVTALVRTHGQLVFSQGLPELPHDFGYRIYYVTVTPENVVVQIVLPSNQRLRKMGRKLHRCANLIKAGELPSLTQFGLPVEWRFEGGSDNPNRRAK